MRAPAKPAPPADGWTPIPDPEGYFSTGIPDLDRLMGGGYRRGSTTLLSLDESVGIEDLDLLLFPALLNMLYQSRGLVAVLPSRDSPHGFRSRLTEYATRRRFDSRVRICDYAGEDAGVPYVVSLQPKGYDLDRARRSERMTNAAIAKMVAAEKAAQGTAHRPFVELTAFEVFETLMGVEPALKMYYYGVKRTRSIGNLGIGVLGPGLGCAAGVRRLVDNELALRREEVGLVVRGVRPSFSSHVVAIDAPRGLPHVSFVPRPA